MNEDWKKQLESRFAGMARGRTVSVKFEAESFLLAHDYRVGFNATTETFEVLFRSEGCFEGAYRCIERYIEAYSDHFEPSVEVPDGHLDLRRTMLYWMIERIYEQFRSDLESAVASRISLIEQERPGENLYEEIGKNTRVRSLVGMLAHLEAADREVRRGILSPLTIELLRSIGLDLFPEEG